MTERRQEYIRAIAWYFRRNDQFPSCETLGQMMGVVPSGAQDMYGKLERAGIVSRNHVGKFKRGPRWPQEESCDRHDHEHGAQTHPAATAQSETFSKLAFRVSNSWPPDPWCNKTPEGATSDCTRYTSRQASAQGKSWYSRTPRP